MEELTKSIACLEQIILDKTMKVEGAQKWMTSAKSTVDRLAEGPLTTDQALELLEAQKQHAFAKKCIDVEEPLINKLKNDIEELKRKETRFQQRTDDNGS